MIQVQDNGKVTVKGYKLDFYGGVKNKIFFNVIDTEKFMYENGYQKKGLSRVVSKNKTIRFAGVVLDLSKVTGIQNLVK